MARDLEPGAEVGGYRIEGELGRGGMGVVYLAVQLGLGRRVALKLVAPDLAEDEQFRVRFQQEAKHAASLDHPNIVPVFEGGEADGHLYLSMRYVDGTDLRELIRQGPLDPVTAAAVTVGVGAALDSAHSNGLVHRDVKPANILLAETGSGELHAYLSDFGLTTEMASRAGLTGTGQWVGTLDYVAPEQIATETIDARTDVYALGCVVFQMLTGRLPYEGTDTQKMWAHMQQSLPLPSQVSQDLSGFDPVIERSMAKDPEDRFPSAGDLARAAHSIAHGDQVGGSERSVARGAAAKGIPPELGDTKPHRTKVRSIGRGSEARTRVQRDGRRRKLLIGGGVAALLALGIGGGALVAGGGNGESATVAGPTITETTAETETVAPGPAEPTPEPGAGSPSGFQPYVPAARQFAYETVVPSGNGWSTPTESELTEGELLRTTVDGPGGLFLLIDYTPFEEPQTGGQADSRETVSHPTFGSAERLVLSSSENIPECSGAPCVDYLVDDGRGGGWGVLAGGGALPTADAVALEVMSALRPGA